MNKRIWKINLNLKKKITQTSYDFSGHNLYQKRFSRFSLYINELFTGIKSCTPRKRVLPTFIQTAPIPIYTYTENQTVFLSSNKTYVLLYFFTYLSIFSFTRWSLLYSLNELIPFYSDVYNTYPHITIYNIRSFYGLRGKSNGRRPSYILFFI